MMIMNKTSKVNTLPSPYFLFDRIWHTHIEGFKGQNKGIWKAGKNEIAVSARRDEGYST
jgi:hypothetical protein